MRSRTTIILLLVAVAALAYFFLIEQPRHRREQRATEARSRLAVIVPDDVVMVSVWRADAHLEFVREDEEWMMVHPARDRADDAAVNVLTHTIAGAHIERRLSVADDELGRYGLSPPAAEVALSTGGDPFRIRVGDFNVDKSFCYAQMRPGEVLLVPTGLRRYATQAVDSYRDDRVTAYELPDVTAMTIINEVDTMRWERRRWDEWVLPFPGDTVHGAALELESILRELRGQRAERIIDDAELPAPVGTLRVYLGPDSVQTYTFARTGTDSALIASSLNPRLVVVPPDILAVFQRTLHDLRDRAAVHFSIGELGRVTLETPAQSVSVVKTDGRWTFANPARGAIDEAAVHRFLLLLKDVKFREIKRETLSDPAHYGLDRPEVRLTLATADGQVVDELVTGESRTIQRIRYATSRSTGWLGIIDSEPIDDLVARFEAFRLR